MNIQNGYTVLTTDRTNETNAPIDAVISSFADAQDLTIVDDTGAEIDLGTVQFFHGVGEQLYARISEADVNVRLVDPEGATVIGTKVEADPEEDDPEGEE